MGRHIGRLRSFLVGLCLISTTVAVCPQFWQLTDQKSDFFPDKSAQCTGGYEPGCKVKISCMKGFVPTDSRWANMLWEMECGADDKWRDLTGKEVQLYKDSPDILACRPACVYNFDPVASHFIVTQAPSELLNFTNPRDNNKMTTFIPSGDSFKTICTGDRIALYTRNEDSNPTTATYTCNPDELEFHKYFYNNYLSPDARDASNIERACWYYCPFDWTNKVGNMPKIDHRVPGKAPNGAVSNTSCIPGFAYPPGSSGAVRGYQYLECNAEDNSWTDLLTNDTVQLEPCIMKGEPGECRNFNLTNHTVISTSCESTVTGVKDPCTMTVICKHGMHPVDSKYLEKNNGSQTLSCRNGFWMDEDNSYANIMECDFGCIKEVANISEKGWWSQNTIPGGNGTQCVNITYFKQAPPYHPYYCDDLRPTGYCNGTCTPHYPIPVGVRLINHTLAELSYSIVPLLPYLLSGHSLVYGCEEGYMYPPDSSPARHGNRQEFHCNNESYTDVDQGKWVEIVPCVPITGCPQLQPADNVIISNKSENCVLDKDKYNHGCVMKYDCASGYYPTDTDYLNGDGQDLICQAPTDWYNQMKEEVVNQTLTCQYGCISMNWSAIIPQVSDTTNVTVTVIPVKDTAGEEHYCFDKSVLQAIVQIWNQTMHGKNKYFCETRDLVNITITIGPEDFGCPGGCRQLNISVLPAGLKLVDQPATYTYEGTTFVGSNKTYVFQCEEGTNVYGKDPSYLQKLQCNGLTYTNLETGQNHPSFSAADLQPCTKSPVCHIRNDTNIVVSLDCTQTDGTVTMGCTVNTTCMPGFYAVDILGITDNRQSRRCNITETNNATWVTITVGEPTEEMICYPGNCTIPPSTDNVDVTSSCQIINGQVTTNCTVTEECKNDLIPVDITGVVDGRRESICNTTKSENGTLINIAVGEPIPPLTCGDKPTCQARPNTTSVVVTTTCRAENGRPLNAGCKMTEECAEGMYPINIKDKTERSQTSECKIGTDGTARWIEISVGEPSEALECAAPCNTTTPPGTKLTHECVAVQGGLAVGCNATLSCEDDLVPIDINGKTLTNVTCDGKGHNSTWIVISTGEPVKNTSCGCPAPKFDNNTQINSTCYVAGVGGIPGCSLEATCEPGSAPIYGSTRETTNTTIYCDKTTTGKYTWIEIGVGEEYPGKDCLKKCPNLTIPNAHITYDCPTNNGSYPVNCPATAVCNDGFVGYNVKYNSSSTVNVICKNITSENSTFIEISTGQPLEDFCTEKGCEPINGTNINITSDCVLTGGVVPLNCSVNTTCLPGTYYPVDISGKSSTDLSVYCDGTKNKNATWVVISTGEELKKADCSASCKFKEVPYTTVHTECPKTDDGGYQKGCQMQLQCIDGYVGINVNYKYASIVNISCNSVDTTNNTFIEISTGLPLEEEICGPKPTTVAPIVCPPIDSSNDKVTSDCYTAGSGAPLECEADVTCLPGTYPVYISGKETTNVTRVKCTEDPTTKKSTWIVISTGEEYKSKDCKHSCPFKPVNHTTATSDCKLESNGEYAVGCTVQLKCDPGYTGINVNYKQSSIVNITCKDITSQNSTFIEIEYTNKPVENEICGPTEKCETFNTTHTNVISDCYTNTGAVEGCNATLVCVPGTYPIYVGGNMNTTIMVVCDKKSNRNASWVVISTGDEIPWTDCRPPCAPITIPNTKKTYTCPVNEKGEYQVNCGVTLECDEGFIPITTEVVQNGIIKANCTSKDNTTSTWINIATGQPVKEDVCQPGCDELNPGSGAIQTDQSCTTASKYAAGCKKNFVCAEPSPNPTGPTTNTAECRVSGGKGSWIDPATNLPYVPLNCPPPKGCTPIHHDPSTTVNNKTCTPSNPPQSIHPENCMVDVACLDDHYPTIEALREVGKHQVECIKNGTTGGYEWYDRTVDKWWTIYTCTKGCLNETLPTQKNTTTIDNRVCEFTTQPFGTGRYMCNQTEFPSVNCTDTCPKLIANDPLKIVTYPPYILTQVVAVDGQYVVYCPDGYFWNGTKSSSKTFTCTKNGTYVSDKPGDKATIEVIDDCQKPTEYPKNCTLTLTDGQEIKSSTCDTEADDTYAEGCVVEIQCKNGTSPKENTSSQKRECKDEDWVDPKTKQRVTEYPCGPDCKNTTGLPTETRTETKVVGNITVTCTIKTIEREMIKYICGNETINPMDPVVEEKCDNTCNRIGLDVNMTNTRTNPDLVHDKVPLGGETEVQCPPDTVFQETGSRTNWYKCMADGTYNGPNGTTGLNFVKNTCVDPDNLNPCGVLNNTNVNVDSQCYIATSGGLLGCKANITCIPNTYPVSINGKTETTTSVECKTTTTGNNTWVDISTGAEVPGKICLPPCNNFTIPHSQISYSCIGSLVNGRHQVGCDAVVQCDEGYFPITAETGTNGIVNAKCTSQTKDSSTFVNIRTGQPIRGDVCQPNPGCSELDPGAGVVETSTTCGPVVPYRGGCLKEFACAVSNPNPNPGERTTNTAKCNVDNGTGTWVDPDTNGPYKRLNCPPTPGCTPIHTDPSTTVNNKTCTPSNPPQSIHPENCVVDVVCLANHYPTDEKLQELPEHKAECIKNSSGGYNWFDRTVNAWWDPYSCTKGCLNKTLTLQRNTTTIDNRICEFTTQPFGTGRYMCNQTEFPSVNCTDTCPKLIANDPLKIVTYPPFILTQVVAVDGQYVVYCPDGYFWNGTKSSSKTFTCTKNGTYVSSQPGDKATIVVVDDCQKPTEYPKNCTLTLTDGQEIKSSTCDTEADDTYAEGCVVEIQCKNGTSPKGNTSSQKRECKDEDWVDPKTKERVTEYPCDPKCKDMKEVPKDTRTEEKVVGNVTVTCTIKTIEREMIKYLCNTTDINPMDPIVEESCVNTCDRIGLDVNMTNTRTRPDLVHDRVPLGGKTEVQCPPDTVFQETGSRTNWYKCMADGTYNGPNGTTGLNFVKNTCVNPDDLIPCGVLNNTNANVDSQCYIATTGGLLDCKANVTCIPNTYPVHINGKEERTTSVICKNTTEGKKTWVEISTGDEVLGVECQPPCDNLTSIPNTKITYSCSRLTDNGKHNVGCNVTLECQDGYIPITTEVGENGLISGTCKNQNSQTSAWINIKTGQPIRREDLCQPPVTEKPREKCKWLVQPGTNMSAAGSSDHMCADLSDVFFSPLPGVNVYENCVIELVCKFLYQVPSNYGHENKTIQAICNQTDANGGIWYEVATGQVIKNLNCVNWTEPSTPPPAVVCPELELAPGVTEKDQTCPRDSTYAVGCKKNLACAETTPNPTGPTTNTAECKADGGKGSWVDPATNLPYTPLNCPLPKGCTPIRIDKSTEVTNKTCNPSNPPNSIHPENCVVDVECLADHYPTEVQLLTLGEHKVECIKNGTTGGYEWFDWSVNAWWKIYTCTKGCLNETLPTQKNTTIIDNRHCEFTTQPFGTGRYMCNQTEFPSVNCTDTCPKLIANNPLKIVTYPPFILTQVVAVDGQYVVYCPDGYFWNGTKSSSKTFTCTKNGTYVSDKPGDKATIEVIDDCQKPTEYPKNCTLTLTDGQEIKSSTCDTEADDTYAEGCVVEIQCKNGTSPKENTSSQKRECKDEDWVDPKTKQRVTEYPCGPDCKNTTGLPTDTRTETNVVGNITVTCTIKTIDREMIKYICGNETINPMDPVVEEKCDNTCNRIGLDVNMTNTRTNPDLVHDKVPLGGDTEVQCPPDTVFQETGSRTNWYKCMADGTYNGPNGTTGLNFVKNTCVDPDNLNPCGVLNNTNVNVDSQCYIATSGGLLGCKANITCIPNTYPVSINGKTETTTSVECKTTTTGNNTWVDISTGAEVPGKICLPPCNNFTIPHSQISYSCIGSLVNGRHQVGCDAVVQCDEGYFPITAETGTNGIVNAKCTSQSPQSSTFVNIRTGQPIRGDVCQPNPGCSELDPGAGVVETSTTCGPVVPYRGGCLKEFACAVSNPNPNPGDRTTNTAKCNVDNGTGTWVDPDTNGPYKRLNCPPTPGCTPIHTDPSTTVNNKTCTPSNPPQSIHPENCVVDVVCLANHYPTDERLQELPEHKAECIKNSSGGYNWFDRTVNAWWDPYSCTKGCLNKTLTLQRNTTTIDNRVCEFTTQPFGTGRYMCNQTEFPSVNCTDTCPKLIANDPLKIVTYPPYILTQVVAVDGQYVVYCPDGYFWNGTKSSSKTFTCTKNGTYVSDKPGDKATIVVVDECEKPTEYPKNCTLTLTDGQEIKSSTCDTEADDTYAEGCVVEIQCKNGTSPKENTSSQKRECKDEDWVDPKTKERVTEYPCGPECKNMTGVPRDIRTETKTVGNVTVTCTIKTIEREMIKYICGNETIDPDSIVETTCVNTCNRIGLDVNMTNTRTIPDLVHDKVPLGGDTEVQCPPDTVFIETGSRTNWYKCMADGTYNGPNGTTGLSFVKNTCVDPNTLVKCPEIGPGPGVVQIRQSCSEASSYAVGCTKEYVCADGVPSPGSSGSVSNTTECRSVNGKGTWVDPRTGLSFVQLNCPTPTGCTPIPIDATSSQITNITCTPSNGAIRIHPENCTVDVECKPGYYPTNRNLLIYEEHRSECILDPSTGKYDWFDRTVNAWWKIYTCTKGCINETLPTETNTTEIDTRVCTYSTLPFGTGRFMCNLTDITEAACNSSCRQLTVNSPLRIVTYPELILTKVVPSGGQYVVYCPNGYIWRGTTSASRTYTCLENGTYISNNQIVTEVVNECEKPVNPGPVCSLELLEGQEIVYSTCDTSDKSYEDKCVVKLRCKNGTHPIAGKNGTQEQECSAGSWVIPGTKTPVQPYPCNSTCLIVSVIPSTKKKTTTIVGNTTVTCEVSTIEREIIRHVCNGTFIDPTNPVVEEDCTNTCDRIGLDVNMTNTRTRPSLVHDKVPLHGWTEVQCPPGTVFQETGNRSNWYLCLVDRTYQAPDGSKIIFVKNTCVDPGTVTPPPTPTTPPVGPQPGCEDIKHDPSTTITNKTCVPFPSGIHPEWCIVDVKCKNGTYPEEGGDRNRPEHKVQCQRHDNGTFGWVDLTVGGEWCPYKCLNGCIPVPPGLGSKNTTIKQIGPVTYVCEVITVPHQTGGYYCNVTDDVISSSCNNTCDPLKVNPPTTIIKEPVYIFGKLVPIGGTYEVSCPDSWFYNDTGLSVKNYTCTENGTYTDGDGNNGITEADDKCECINGNCTLEVPENMIVEEVNCPIDDDTYAIGCQVKLRCKKGYRFASLNRTEWISHVYSRWQCTLREDKYIWIDTDSNEPADNETCVEDKDCIDLGEINQSCYSVKESHNGKEVECQYCKYDTALDPYICPNVTRPENGTINVCCDACEELGIAPGLNKRRYAILIFTNKVAVGDYYTVECPTGQVFKETLTRGKNFTCNKGYKYTGPEGENITYVDNTCIEEVKGCGELIIDDSTVIFNETCTPFLGSPAYYPRNCTRDVKCRYTDYRPEQEKNRGYPWQSVECWYNPTSKSYYWYDLTLNAPWQPYKCVNGCINATEPVIRENTSVVVVKENVTIVCNLTVVPYKTGDYYCNTDGDVVETNCNGTCPPLIVEDPLAVGKGPEPLVYKGLVIIGGSYHVICPEGKWYNETTNSTRTYICTDDETYTSENATGLLEAIDTCVDVDVGNCTCTLTVGEGVEINHKYENCPARETNTYGISCAVQLRCKKGYYPVAKDKWTQDQYCSDKGEGDDGEWWLFVPARKAPTFECKKGCISQMEMKEYTTKKQETTTKNGVTSICEVEYIDVELIDKVCDNSSIKPIGEVSRICSNTCNPLEMGAGLTYVPVSPSFWNGLVILWDYYTVQCPHGKVWPETKTEWKKFTCNQDRKYNTSWETGLTIAENKCVDKEEEQQGCKPIEIDGSTVIFNQTCTPFLGSPVYYPRNCTQDVKCRYTDYRPEQEKNRGYPWQSVECWYNPTSKSYYWYDLTLNAPWQPYKCVNGCVNATEPLIRENTSVIVTKENVTMVCNLTVVPYLTGDYYCNTDGDVVETSCNGTCPPLIVEDPLAVGKGPEPLVYKGLVIIGGSYHVICPEGKWYNETSNSTRTYICTDDETYTSENATGLLEAIDTCVDVDTGNCTCTLTVEEGVEINHKYENCPARETNTYGISCAVQLRCKKGYYPVVKDKRTQDQYCSAKGEGDDGNWWLFVPDQKAPTFRCKKGCISQMEMKEYTTKKQETITKNGVTSICEVEYLDIELIDKVCDNSTIKPNGEVSRTCSNTCNPLEMGAGLTYVPVSPSFWNGLVILWDYYTVQCPHGKVWPETKTEWKKFTCNQDRKYNTSWETGLTIAENKCVDKEEEKQGCKPIEIDGSTVIFNQTCTPFTGSPSIYPTNCTVDVKCRYKDYRPEEQRSLYFGWHSVECWYNTLQKNWYWHDLTLDTPWKPYKCVNDCINATEPMIRENTSVVVTKENVTIVCNITTVNFLTGGYYCDTDGDVVDASCNGTCPPLIVEDPLAIGKGPEPLVYKGLVIIGGSYHVICPEGKWYNETCKSTRKYICDDDEKYTSENQTGLLEAIDTCVDVDTGNCTCTLTVGEGVEINHKYENCPARTTNTYGISCAVQLRCKKGYRPIGKITQEQYCSDKGEGDDGTWWLFDPDQKAPTFGCKKNENECIGQVEMKEYTTRVTEKRTRGSITAVCEVDYLHRQLIDEVCNKSSVLPTGEVVGSRKCNGTCNPLEMGPGMTYVPISPQFWNGLVFFHDTYNVQCPNGKVWPETMSPRKEFVCSTKGTYSTNNETGLMIALDKCVPDNCTDTTTSSTTTTTTTTSPSIPCCSDRAPPPEGTLAYGYNCTQGNNVEGCKISYKCLQDWYPISAADQKLLNRTAICNGSLWIDPTTDEEFEDFLCQKGCINDTSHFPKVTRIEQQVQIGDTTVCCNKTYLEGITRLYYCNYTKYLSIACTETCPPLKVITPPMSIVFYPERRVPELDLIFRGTKYTVSCPAGKVFSGTKDSYRNYTCDHDGTYYTDTRGGLTAAETDCVDVPTTTPTCSLVAPPAPVITSSKCPPESGKYAVSCVVYLSCTQGNHPAAVEDQAYPNRAIVCKQQTDGSVAWENIRTGKIVTDMYSCNVGCLTTTPNQEAIKINGMVCDVTSIPTGSIDHQCDSSVQPSGIKETNCSKGCKDLPYDKDHMETSGPTILYDHVKNGTSYTLYCSPGMHFNTTLSIQQTYICQEDGSYLTTGGAKYIPGTPMDTCVNPGPVISPDPIYSKTDIKLEKPCNPGGETRSTSDTSINKEVTDEGLKVTVPTPPADPVVTQPTKPPGKGLR